jgi:signal transduction histidine kinase
LSQPSPLDGTQDPTATPPAPPAGPLARLSLEQKLPLILAGLSLAVVAGLSAVSIYEVRSTTMAMGVERLTALNQQFATLFSMSGPQQRTQAVALATRPGVMEFARTHSLRSVQARTSQARDRALADLRAPVPNPEQVLVSELRDSRGRVLLTSRAGTGVDTMTVADIFPNTAHPDSATIGVFRRLRDTLVFPVSMAVQGSTDVYAVRWRRVNITSRTADAVSRLIGTYATPYLGNPGGEHWVNFQTIVPPPPLDMASTTATQVYERDGQQYLAAKASLSGAPWMVALEVPMKTILAPAAVFQRRFFTLGLVALALAFFAAHYLSKRLTKPLVQLAGAATRIAGGDFSHPVRINSSDEIGKLGVAFATMATEVQSARDNLERKVEERTKQLHEAQEALVRRERLALLGQLSSGVGHELRNPLSVMTNSVYLLRLHLESQPKNVHEYLDILQQQIALSEKIVSDLLDFTRSRPPQRKPTSLTEVSEQQVARLGQMEGVNIESTLNGNLPAVLVDSSQAGQIILNLLANAVQAIDGPGLIRIKGLADGDRVHMDVMDSGPGVPSDILDKIFEPLFTTKARGLGLGLAVSRTLARANGGDLTASNSPNGGAVFRLSLPIATAEMH